MTLCDYLGFCCIFGFWAWVDVFVPVYAVSLHISLSLSFCPEKERDRFINATARNDLDWAFNTCVVLCFHWHWVLVNWFRAQMHCIASIVLNFTSFMSERGERSDICILACYLPKGFIIYVSWWQCCKNQNNFMKRNEMKWNKTKHKMWKENAHKLCIDYRVTSHSDVLLTFRFSADGTQIVTHANIQVAFRFRHVP